MNVNFALVVAFVLFIFVSYSCQFSFAKTNNEKEDDKKNKDIAVLPIKENKTRNYDLKESNIQKNTTNTFNDKYPDQYYVCGYPKQLITNYSFLEKLNCD